MDRSIQSMVQREAAKNANAMSPETFFRSELFEEHLNSLIGAMTEKYGTYNLKLHWGSLDGETACTDGRTIKQNLHNELVWNYEDLYSKYLAQIGMTFHEISHILWNDFDADQIAIDVLKSGNLYGAPPTGDAVDVQEFIDAVGNPLYHEIFIKMWNDIANILADPHDEEKSIDKFGGLVEQAIVTLRTSLQSGLPSVEKQMGNPNADKLAVLYGLMLQYARFGEVVCEDEQNLSKYEPMTKIMTLSSVIDSAVGTDNHKTRGGYINQIMFTFWPYIRDELDKQQQSSGGQPGDPNNNGQNGQGSNQSSNSNNGSNNAVQSVLNSMAQGNKNSGATTAPQNAKTNKIAKKEQSKGGSGQKTDENKDAGSQAFNNVLQAVAQASAEKSVQNSIAQAEIGRIHAENANSSHKNINVTVKKADPISAQDISTYNSIMKDVANYSKRLQKLIFEALRDIKEGGIIHHKSFGNIVEAKYSYRPDEKYYASKKLPQDLPDMAIAVLIDHSGSMYGSRLAAAQKAAMLLQDFATNSGIPVYVAGHCTSGHGVTYYLYTDFDSVNNKEKYRLSQMKAGGCNRDGCAINLAASALAKRPEEVKLLIVISDGQPNHDGYGGTGAAKDIQTILRKYKKSGVEPIAMAIGSDKENIREIYGDECFIDIDDLEKLPKAMVGLVKKRVLKYI